MSKDGKCRKAKHPKQQQAMFCSSSKMSKDGKCHKAKGHHDALWYYEYIWDTMFALKQDLMCGHAHGCLCEYNPTTDQTHILVDDIHFANGLAIDLVQEEWIVPLAT